MINAVGSSKELLHRLREAVEKSADQVWTRREAGSDPGSEAFGSSRLTHLLGLMLAGAGPAELAKVSPDRIGYGSSVMLRDVETHEVSVLRVMNSGAMDIGAGHTSLDSPFGQVLVGRASGDVVEVRTPGGARTFEVVDILTMPTLIERIEARDQDESRGAGGAGRPTLL